MSYILSGARTPGGSFMKSLTSMSASQLGAVAIKDALKKADISLDQIDEVFMGHVVQAGAGQAPARQAALFADLPESVPCTTLNKVCGSGLKAVISGVQSIKAGDNQVVVCGGMESMSQSPHLFPSSRTGVKYGESSLVDSLYWDGLRDVYTNRAMGNCAEECVDKYNFTRKEQDEYAMESFRRAQKAITDGVFKDEIVSVNTSKGDVCEDEGPGKVRFEKIPHLPPAFKQKGTITAANASSLNDGAAAVVIGGEKFKQSAKFKIISYAGHAQNPTWFTTAPIEAMRKCLEKTRITFDDIDLFEINEAFSVVPLAVMKDLSLDHDKVNIYGGGISLGHPIGSSGCRILVTLMNAMMRNNASLGMASLCIGGGEGLALLLERLS